MLLRRMQSPVMASHLPRSMDGTLALESALRQRLKMAKRSQFFYRRLNELVPAD